MEKIVVLTQSITVVIVELMDILHLRVQEVFVKVHYLLKTSVLMNTVCLIIDLRLKL